MHRRDFHVAVFTASLAVAVGAFALLRRGALSGGPSLPPPLSPEQEKALLDRMAAGDAAAREELITHNLRLVVYLAKKYENSGVPAEKVEAFQQECRKQYGEDAALNPKNIIESGKFQITTPEVKIAVAPEYSYMIEARVIDGRRYILIPADDGVEINGIGVNIPNPQSEEA